MEIFYLNNRKKIVKILVILVLLFTLVLVFSGNAKAYSASIVSSYNAKIQRNLYVIENRVKEVIVKNDKVTKAKNDKITKVIDSFAYFDYEFSRLEPCTDYMVSFDVKGYRTSDNYKYKNVYVGGSGEPGKLDSMKYPLYIKKDNPIKTWETYSSVCKSNGDGIIKIKFMVYDEQGPTQLCIRNINIAKAKTGTVKSDKGLITLKYNKSLIAKICKKLNCKEATVESNLKTMINELEKAYFTMEDLTGVTPKTGEYIKINGKKHGKILIDATPNTAFANGALAYACTNKPLIVYDEEVLYDHYIMIANAKYNGKKLGFKKCWDQTLVHELGHKFQFNAKGQTYDFCSFNIEAMNEVVVALVLEKNCKYSFLYDGNKIVYGAGGMTDRYYENSGSSIDKKNSVRNLAFCILYGGMNESITYNKDYYDYMKTVIRKNNKVSELTERNSLRRLVKTMTNNKVDLKTGSIKAKDNFFGDAKKTYNRLIEYYKTNKMKTHGWEGAW